MICKVTQSITTGLRGQNMLSSSSSSGSGSMASMCQPDHQCCCQLWTSNPRQQAMQKTRPPSCPCCEAPPQQSLRYTLVWGSGMYTPPPSYLQCQHPLAWVAVATGRGAATRTPQPRPHQSAAAPHKATHLACSDQPLSMSCWISSLRLACCCISHHHSWQCMCILPASPMDSPR